MHKYLCLTRALMKNNLNLLSTEKGGKAKAIALYILLGICILPLFGMIYIIFREYFDAYGTISQSGSVLAMGFMMSAFLVFFFSLFVIPGVFYFSKDNDILLSLPLKPHTILSAKFTNCLLYDYSFSFFVVIPLGIAYAQSFPLGIWEIVCFLLVAFTLPIIPLIYSSIITMVVMRFIPFFKNKDTFNLISGILILVISISFSFIINSMGAQDEVALMDMLMEGNNSMVQLFSMLFPFISSGSQMIFNADILQFGVYVVWHLGFIALFLLAGKYLYFKAAIGINESASKAKGIDFHKSMHRTPIIRSYAIKELKILVRTPVYFLNCIMSVAILPIMFFIIFLQESTREGLSMIPLDEIMAYPQFSYYIILGIVLFCCFIAPLNMVSSTAISREGDHVSFMKFIPVSYEKQLYAKTINGIILSILSIVPLWILLLAYLGFPIVLSIVSLIGIILSSIAINLIAILIDTSRPKLIWEQEAAAVKQNLNSMLTLLIGFLFSAGIGVGMFILPDTMMMYFIIFVYIVFIATIIICYFLIMNYAGKLFEKIS